MFRYRDHTFLFTSVSLLPKAFLFLFRIFLFFADYPSVSGQLGSVGLFPIIFPFLCSLAVSPVLLLELFPLFCVACPFCTSLSLVLWALSPGDAFLTKDLFSSFFRSLTLRMAEKWSTLHGWNQRECVDRYLENARRWPFFGCKLFQAQV